MQHQLGVCRLKYDMGQKVADTTVSGECESQDIDVYGRFASPLDEGVTRE